VTEIKPLSEEFKKKFHAEVDEIMMCRIESNIDIEDLRKQAEIAGANGNGLLRSQLLIRIFKLNNRE